MTKWRERNKRLVTRSSRSVKHDPKLNETAWCGLIKDKDKHTFLSPLFSSPLLSHTSPLGPQKSLLYV